MRSLVLESVFIRLSCLNLIAHFPSLVEPESSARKAYKDKLQIIFCSRTHSQLARDSVSSCFRGACRARHRPEHHAFGLEKRTLEIATFALSPDCSVFVRILDPSRGSNLLFTKQTLLCCSVRLQGSLEQPIIVQALLPWWPCPLQ